MGTWPYGWEARQAWRRMDFEAGWEAWAWAVARTTRDAWRAYARVSDERKYRIVEEGWVV